MLHTEKKDCLKSFWESLREYAMDINNFKMKKKLLTKELHKTYGNSKFCYICKEKCQNKTAKNEK